MQLKNIFMYGACLLPVAAMSWMFIDLASGNAAYPIFFVAYVAVLLTGAVCELVTHKLYGRWLLGLKWGEWAGMTMMIYAMLPLMVPTVETYCRSERHRNAPTPVEVAPEQ